MLKFECAGSRDDIAGVRVNLAGKRAQVLYDRRVITAEDVVNAIDDMGYDATLDRVVIGGRRVCGM